MNQANNARIFISYSHRGNGPKWKAALLRGLHVLERHHLLDVWQDGKIRVSSFWNDDIKRAMADARLAVVLVTKEALESEYILAEEFPVLRERQQRDKLPVFPIICEPCDWRSHYWLRATQTPNSSNPLSELKPEAQERVFHQLATAIAEELSHVALRELLPSGEPLGDDHIYLDRLLLTRTSGTREEKLIGREQELALLDLALAQLPIAIVSLVAWGGVGKTMLVQHWLQRLQREGWFGARRVYAWSFYSQGTKEDRQASEDTFLAHALEWFGVQCDPTLSPWDKGRLLADAIARERALLILDGIEPLQYPPGPMGGQLRARGVQSLLKHLARKANTTEHRGLCLVTTREPLTDLADFQRRPDAAWGSLLRVDLGNLTEEAGAALLHHAGAKRAGSAEIKADDTELLAASREVDGHALTLNLLGRFLARAHGGDIRRRDLVKFEEADRTEQGGTTFKMLAAFEDWFAKSGEFGACQLSVLRMLGLFDGPADAGCIAALRKPPVIAGLTDPLFTTRLDASTGQATVQSLLDESWNTVTSFLADFGLVLIQADTDSQEYLLDCHSLIREYFGNNLPDELTESRCRGHHRLFEHLVNLSSENPRNWGELQSAFAAVYHGCKAGRFGECLKLEEKVFHQCRFYFGANSALLSAVSCFFEDPWDRVSATLSAEEQTAVRGSAAFCLRELGRIDESSQLTEALRNQCLRNNDWESVIAQTNSLCDDKVYLGHLQEALGDMDRTLRTVWHQRPIRQGLRVRMIGRRAYILHQMGKLEEALDEFRHAEAIQFPRLDAQACPVLYSIGGFWFCGALLDEIELAANQPGANRNSLAENCEGVIDRARTSYSWTSDSVTGGGGFRPVRTFGGRVLAGWLDHLTIGRALFMQQRLKGEDNQSEPLEIVDMAVNGLRELSRPFLGIALHLRAQILLANNYSTRAKEDLDEAWDIAERGPMQLHMVDIHLHRARLFFRERPYPWRSPQDDLAAARRLIEQCSYWRRKEELEDTEEAAKV
jgi:tetratricopeptide (TPR) repeat protein